MPYNPQEIESKWQEYWEKNGFYKADDFSRKNKFYALIEFPYPSGAGLHVGHVRSYAAMDALARKKRMEGFNVLYPIGWDAFGLPTENYAIKMGIHPSVATAENVKNFKKQLKSLGLSFDWSREVNTTDPDYYKWTQWIFLKLFEKGLAYQADIPINWCPSCKIGLANEEVVGSGECERCHTGVEKKQLKQWMIKITAYADKLIDDLNLVDFPEKVKAQQINWIGRSYGTEMKFKMADLRFKNDEEIIIFTTRADTLFGVTAVVLAPEHPLAEKLITKENEQAAKDYIAAAKNKSDIERETAEKEKTGVFTGSYCINPANNEKIPVWIGDYVVASYGGGAVMVVPAHDQRDFEFAQKYNLPIKMVVCPNYPKAICPILDKAYTGEGHLVGSGEFDGLPSKEAIDKITAWLEKKSLGEKKIHYKLRDWVFSRQHYWGEPIPIVHCQKCGQVPVFEKDLPIELPYVEKYQPTGTGESPLAQISEWVHTKCPKCKGPAKRETDTMPNWAGSNWYYLAYATPKLNWDKKRMAYWMPVDWYNGGFEHTTLHLLYSRFIFKFLWDIGVAPKSIGSEPYKKRTSHGIVLAEDGRKMSKSFGNVINPDEIVGKLGADTLRLYEMFMGPFDQAISWSTNGMKGCHRFLSKAWDLCQNPKSKIQNLKIEKLLHQTIKKVTEDMENMRFNTAISALMILVNEMQATYEKDDRSLRTLLLLLAPFAPHMAEELWRQLGNKDSVHNQKWPEYDKKLIEEKVITFIVQINGKVRDKIELPFDISEAQANEQILKLEKVKTWLAGKEIKKTIFVPGKLINLVIQ